MFDGTNGVFWKDENVVQSTRFELWLGLNRNVKFKIDIWITWKANHLPFKKKEKANTPKMSGSIEPLRRFVGKIEIDLLTQWLTQSWVNTWWKWPCFSFLLLLLLLVCYHKNVVLVWRHPKRILIIRWRTAGTACGIAKWNFPDASLSIRFFGSVLMLPDS